MKFVKITYGSDPESDKEPYVYLANDNVRVGDIVSPTFTHVGKEHKLCVTTGVIRSQSKVGAKGSGNEEMMDTLGAKTGDVKRLFTGADLGIGRLKDKDGKYVKDTPQYDDKGHRIPTQYEEQVRNAALNRSGKEGVINAVALVNAMNKARQLSKAGPTQPKLSQDPYSRVMSKEESGAAKRTFANDQKIIEPYAHEETYNEGD